MGTEKIRKRGRNYSMNTGFFFCIILVTAPVCDRLEEKRKKQAKKTGRKKISKSKRMEEKKPGEMGVVPLDETEAIISRFRCDVLFFGWWWWGGRLLTAVLFTLTSRG